jgi:hypothetical protein
LKKFGEKKSVLLDKPTNRNLILGMQPSCTKAFVTCLWWLIANASTKQPSRGPEIFDLLDSLQAEVGQLDGDATPRLLIQGSTQKFVS